MHMTVNAERLLADMKAQAAIGATTEGGLNRPALSENDLAVRGWFKQHVLNSGLEFNEDGAANLSAVLKCQDSHAKTLMLGSHLDSVPHGGRFDGALGVLSALEVLRTLKDHAVEPPFHLECISFTDEESHLIALLGSGALSGMLSPAALQNPRCPQDEFEAALQRAGITPTSILQAKRNPAGIQGYLELHIEQGTRLEDAKLQISVVTSIVGIRAMWLHFLGEAAHAGTMPVLKRKDAFLGAALFTQKARELVIEHYLPGVVNVGQVRVGPGAFNIVPGEASISVEFRHGTTEQLDKMEDNLINLAKQIAEDNGLGLRIEPMTDVEPAQMHETLRTAIESAADTLQLRHTRLMSFAGHDPQNMARIIPSAMFFVPSKGGISHNPQEYTSPEDCINGANVLLHTVLQLAAAMDHS